VSTLRAVAFEDSGRWVVNCPNGCGNAWAVDPKEKERQCYLEPQPNGNGGYTKAIGCMAVFVIDWPSNPRDLFAGRRAAMNAAKQAQQRYLAEARREHDAQHTDEDGEKTDGIEKATARSAAARKGADHE
jgi:hypothetical protein